MFVNHLLSFVSVRNLFVFFFIFLRILLCNLKKPHFLLLELEGEALPARVTLPADKKTSHSVAILVQTFLFGVAALP